MATSKTSTIEGSKPSETAAIGGAHPQDVGTLVIHRGRSEGVIVHGAEIDGGLWCSTSATLSGFDRRQAAAQRIRPSTATDGWTSATNFGFDIASNTAYGPLIGHFDLNAESGNGFDNPGGSITYVNTGYVTWAGITAGKAQSFYSFIGGGDNWANFVSPDQKGFNEPNLMAYTASFGGGFRRRSRRRARAATARPAAAPTYRRLCRRAEQREPALNRRASPIETFGGQRGRTSSARCMSSRAGARPGLRRDP